LTNLIRELQTLQQLEPTALYSRFHQLQSSVLVPQWNSYAHALCKDFDPDKFVHLFGPQSPKLPERYDLEIHQEITQNQSQQVLVLNYVLDFVENPLETLKMAHQHGFECLLINESPKDNTFQYKSNPEISFFKQREVTSIERYKLAAGNKSLETVLQGHRQTGWSLKSDTCLDFHYSTDVAKKTLVQMELALELIEGLSAAPFSQIASIQEDLLSWYSAANSSVIVKGCSRWLKLKRLKLKRPDIPA
jgi:hypothetical protein